MKNIIKTLTVFIGLNVALNTSAFAALKYDSDVPKSIQDQMEADLQFINSVTGSSQTPFHKEIFDFTILIKLTLNLKQKIVFLHT